MSPLAISDARNVGNVLLSAHQVLWSSKTVINLEGETMLQVRKDMCLGCGLCAESCPLQAISLLLDQAENDQSRCNQCRLCVEVCPQWEIVEMVPVSRKELETDVVSMKQRTDDLIERIDRLKQHLVPVAAKNNLNRENVW